MKLVFLTRYGMLGASSRVRATQFGEALAAEGVEASFLPLLSDRYLRAKYMGKSAPAEVAACYARRLRRLPGLRIERLIWIEKELFPFVPFWVEAAVLGRRRYVLDLDDAIFHNYDRARSQGVRVLLGDKIDRLMAGAVLVTAGNAYLAHRARVAGASRVEVLPSVVDLNRYPAPTPSATPPRKEGEPFRVVWVGSPATVRYLDVVRRPFESFAQSRALEVHVIGAAAPQWKSVKTVSVPWSLEGEAASIGCCDVGIMPLVDSPWERGKCGYKLIQYMACRLPVIGSPVGVNVEIVEDGVNGFLASTENQWEAKLHELAEDPGLRRAMGLRGRAKVETRYSVQAVAPRLAALLKEAAR